VIGHLSRQKQAIEIDPAHDRRRCRPDARDAVGVPHIGPHLTPHELELVQGRHGHATVAHGHALDQAKRGGIVKSERAVRRAIAQDEIAAIARQAPSVAVVTERPLLAKRRAVVHECQVTLPGELDELATPFGQAFSEVPRFNGPLVNDGARLQLHFAD
jgi:hypothetical protein